MNSLQIEWLKSRRTKSLGLSALMMIVTILWDIMLKQSEVTKPELQTISVLFNNQTSLSLMLPLLISSLSSRLVSNEKVGQTFKLQVANGYSMMQLFYQKMRFVMLIIIGLNLLYVLALVSFGLVHGLVPSGGVIVAQFFAQCLGSLTMVCFYLTLAFLLDKQGLVLALGFLGAFIGNLLASQTENIWGLVSPFNGVTFLSPFKFHYLGEMAYTYIADGQLLSKLVLYLFYSSICLTVSRWVMQRRKGSLL